MGLRREPYGRAHLAFIAAVAIVGWGLLVWASARAGFAVAGDSPESFALFLAFCLAARLLAFESLQGMAISLDSAFYVAAIWTVGPLAAAWIAGSVFFLHKAWSTVHREIKRGERRPVAARLAEVGYAGGSVAAQFLLLGWVVPFERLHELTWTGSGPWGILAVIPVLTLLVLAQNYGMAAASLWLQGHSGADIRRVLRRGIPAELLQVPLSIAVVQVFDPLEPFNFILLGATFILMAAVFRRLTRTSASLRLRVGELTTLNELGRAMSGTLQLEELLETIARSTMSALDRASVMAIGLWVEKDGALKFRVFPRGEPVPDVRSVPRGEGVSGWVLQHKQSLLVADLAEEAVRLPLLAEDRDKQIRSWLGVPLVVYDEAIGVLSVQSAEPGAFGEDERRLLEAIGRQAAVALENARLYELATVDGLTQLYVRRYFDQRLEEEWMRSARYHAPFAVVLVDLDDFKSVNDRFGHQVGDRLLREAAAMVKRKMRAVDIAARYGGEEFALLLPRASAADALTVSSRIRADLAAHRMAVGGAEVGVTASIGVASYPECGDVDALEVLHRADLALYEAKDTGKNRVVVYRAEERSRVQVI